MRFKDWKNEINHHHSSAHRLERSAERKYLVQDRVGERLYLHVRVLGWPQGEPLVSFTLSHEVLGFVADPLTQLTSEDMTKIALLKEQIEDWVDGNRDSMPDNMTL
jgi:hypothetical protein